ncbi:MAG: hypothetical protein Q7K16_01700 [Candidatus Azambacteria bacterium]|nr:hypothetical protein [Candidatus Azambacteria bacterium]
MKKIFFVLPIIPLLITGCLFNKTDVNLEKNSKETQSSQVPANIQTSLASDEEKDIIKFLGGYYKLYNTENINNGKAFYYAVGDMENALGTDSEIMINVYDDDIKADALANSVTEEMKKNSNKLYQPFTSSDKNNEDAFYITALQIYLPDNPGADIYIIKTFEADRTYMIIYRKYIAGIVSWMLEQEADDWLIENLETYGKAIDEINPIAILANKN